MFHRTMNLLALQRFEEATDAAHHFGELCQKKDLSYYLEGMARRRSGQPEAAVALFDQVSDPSNEDTFKYPLFMLYAERAGALLEAGKAAEAADMLVLLVEENPDVLHITAALKAFTVAGKSLDALVAAMPADRLDKVAAALTLVPPTVADQMADALWARFGPRPQLLAASIRFAPQLNAPRALEWSARLRSIGMVWSCPLLARAGADHVAPAERVRAGVIAHAAFADPKGAELAAAAAPLVPLEDLAAVLSEVVRIDRELVHGLAVAARGTATGPEGSRQERADTIARALASLAPLVPGAQIQNGAALSEDATTAPQLAYVGADR